MVIGMLMPSGGELIVIFLIVLLLFGAKRLPEIAKSLGKSVNEFKKAKDEFVSYSEEQPKEQAKKDEPAPTVQQSSPSDTNKISQPPSDTAPKA